MDIDYKGKNNIRKTIDAGGKLFLAAYVLLGSMYNAPMTGHSSADVYLGLSKPTALEQIIVDKLLK